MGQLRTGNKRHNRAILAAVRAARTTETAAPAPVAKPKPVKKAA